MTARQRSPSRREPGRAPDSQTALGGRPLWQQLLNHGIPARPLTWTNRPRTQRAAWRPLWQRLLMPGPLVRSRTRARRAWRRTVAERRPRRQWPRGVRSGRRPAWTRAARARRVPKPSRPRPPTPRRSAVGARGSHPEAPSSGCWVRALRRGLLAGLLGGLGATCAAVNTARRRRILQLWRRPPRCWPRCRSSASTPWTTRPGPPGPSRLPRCLPRPRWGCRPPSGGRTWRPARSTRRAAGGAWRARARGGRCRRSRVADRSAYSRLARRARSSA
mmetsp:Transcript_62135/g.161474  ORF Transcript_62135/g.161474 Transcript_62135/m.161474 type:complete len:275 (+) Transcript_62135:481-1305(+)